MENPIFRTRTTVEVYTVEPDKDAPEPYGVPPKKEEPVIKYHSEIVKGAKCPNCEQETLYKYDDGKIRCKTCGETR